MMTTEASFVVLFSVATGVAIAVRRLRVPYTVALVVVGLALGALHLVEPPRLTKELLFALFLPGLLFDAAFHLDAREFWRNRWAIGVLAVPGVLLGIVVTAAIATFIITRFQLEPGFSWSYGLVFGALIAATDPIAVVGLFRSLNVPERLTTLIEGESLLNDGTAIVILTLILAYVGGVATSPSALVVRFATIVGGGVLVGGAVGMAVSQMIVRIDEAMIEITLTTIAAYGSFVIGEQFHYSGVIATVTAGMICGNYAKRVGMSPSTQLAVETFWEYIAFALNSIIFLLIGFEVGLGMLAAAWAQITGGYVAVLLARSAVILGVLILLRGTRERLPTLWAPVLAWGGLRGALSMVLALALPVEFPHRTLLITMTFGVVVTSILAQGISMPLMLRSLGIGARGDDRQGYDLARIRLRVAEAASREIDRLRNDHAASRDVLDALQERYARRRAKAVEELAALHRTRGELRAEAAERIVRHLLLIEREQLGAQQRAGLLLPEVYRRLAADIDARLLRLESGGSNDVADLLSPDLADGEYASVSNPEDPASGSGAGAT
jgi:CPA1 family monovalent cation:H+ antiporter